VIQDAPLIGPQAGFGRSRGLDSCLPFWSLGATEETACDKIKVGRGDGALRQLASRGAPQRGNGRRLFGPNKSAGAQLSGRG
jgi:hypothetical protein